jgi:hypothetical protein
LNYTILPALPIRVIQEYSLSHEASSYDLKWGSGIEIEHQWAVKNRRPFITQLSEGFDEESMRGVEKLGALNAHCLLVHCIGFSDEDIQNARNLYGEDLPAKTIFEMITENADKAFLMENRIGTLEEGKLADILILKGRADDPFENLASASMEDIELVMLAGKPIYGEFRFLELLGGKIPNAYHEITVGGRPMFITGDPAALYLSIRRKVGLKKVLDFLPFEPDGGHYA